jgi:hypothetical protein
MLNSIQALFDGQVFHPEQPVALKANTRVRLNKTNNQYLEMGKGMTYCDIAKDLTQLKK